jgi:hypothetical protein
VRDQLDVLAAEDLVDGVAELAVAIVDQERERLLAAELDDEVPRRNDGRGRLRRSWRMSSEVLALAS